MPHIIEHMFYSQASIQAFWGGFETGLRLSSTTVPARFAGTSTSEANPSAEPPGCDMLAA
jgi:hypothetical protein